MFADRIAAAGQLIQRLKQYRGTDAVVLGLARGGVVVANAVAQALDLPLDVVVVKKISPPANPELAIGAVAPDGVQFIDDRFAQSLAVDHQWLEAEIDRKRTLVKQKMQLYRNGKQAPSFTGKTTIIIDDGAATGATAQAAIAWVQQKQASRIVLAVPVAPLDVVQKLKTLVDELIVLDTPESFSAVGEWYEHFDQVEDRDVVQLLV